MGYFSLTFNVHSQCNSFSVLIIPDCMTTDHDNFHIVQVVKLCEKGSMGKQNKFNYHGCEGIICIVIRALLKPQFSVLTDNARLDAIQLRAWVIAIVHNQPNGCHCKF